MRIPDDLPRRWRSYWPDADVDRMARDVEARVDDAIAAWALTGARPLPGGHVGAVLATRDLVLKVSYLMQRLRPGTTLDDAGLPFKDRLRTLGVLAGRLHAAGPAPAAFVPLADYAARWNPGALATPRDDDVLLHADLHGGNVLRDGDGWKVVDPHAARGDRHADVWALLDPLVPAVPDDATALRWVAIYAEAAALDPDRTRAWVHVRAAGEAGDVEPDDPGWAARLRRMAEATGTDAGTS